MSAPQPWECPRCHRINAPHTPTCFCKPGDSVAPAQTAPNDSGDWKRFLDEVGRWPLTLDRTTTGTPFPQRQFVTTAVRPNTSAQNSNCCH